MQSLTLTIGSLLLILSAQSALACDTDRFEVARKGKHLFNGKAVCFGCHGKNGDRSTVSNPDVATLNPAPTDLRDATSLKYPGDQERFEAIRNGLRGTAMPAFRGMLYEQEIKELIEYLEVLKQGGC